MQAHAGVHGPEGLARLRHVSILSIVAFTGVVKAEGARPVFIDASYRDLAVYHWTIAKKDDALNVFP